MSRERLLLSGGFVERAREREREKERARARERERVGLMGVPTAAMRLAPEPEMVPKSERSQEEPGSSDWGLFGCTRREEAGSGLQHRSQIYTYSLRRPTAGCEASIDVLKPISGPGAAGLMHGNFARRASPSLEALSWHVATRRKNFKGAKVLELGAGLGLTGLATAVWTDAALVELTDGDPAVVNTLQRSIELNRESFGNTVVRARLLHWDTTEALCNSSEQFDVVLAGDTVYLTDSHRAHLATIRRWLKPNGLAMVMASTRNGSLHKFVEQAKQVFAIVKTSTDYDSTVSTTFTQGKIKMKCFPVLVKLRHLGDRCESRTAARRVLATQAVQEPPEPELEPAREQEQKPLLQADTLKQCSEPSDGNRVHSVGLDAIRSLDASDLQQRRKPTNQEQVLFKRTMQPHRTEEAQDQNHHKMQLQQHTQQLQVQRYSACQQLGVGSERMIDVPATRDALFLAKQWTPPQWSLTSATKELVPASTAEIAPASATEIRLHETRAELLEIATASANMPLLPREHSKSDEKHGRSRSLRALNSGQSNRVLPSQQSTSQNSPFHAMITTCAAAAAVLASGNASCPPPAIRRAGPHARARKVARRNPNVTPQLLAAENELDRVNTADSVAKHHLQPLRLLSRQVAINRLRQRRRHTTLGYDTRSSVDQATPGLVQRPRSRCDSEDGTRSYSSYKTAEGETRCQRFQSTQDLGSVNASILGLSGVCVMGVSQQQVAAPAYTLPTFAPVAWTH